MTLRIPLVSVWLALALAANSAAAPQHATATRADLTQWLERLRAAGTDVASPLRWRYSFSGGVTACSARAGGRA